MNNIYVLMYGKNCVGTFDNLDELTKKIDMCKNNEFYSKENSKEFLHIIKYNQEKKLIDIQKVA